MSDAVTVFHNPNCGTSRNALEIVRAAGVEPRIVEYLKTGWDREELESLLARMGKRPREVLRVQGTPAEELGLTSPEATDAQIIDAMIAHPILVQRPIVVGPRGVVLARPAERASEAL